MRALRSFTVRPRLPDRLAPLSELAMNLRWSWDERTRDLFRWVDPDLWEAGGHDPVRLLGHVDRARLEQLVADPAFMSFLGELQGDLRRHMEAPRWFQSRAGSPLRSVAYFSPEFGIAEALPQYSGGLGVLAGDHLKAASSLGVPLVGVGLFYRQGYFHQTLDPEGWQRERFVDLDPYTMPIRLLPGLQVQVDLAGTMVRAQVWQAQVGRIPLYLLDSDIEENDDWGRGVTDRLYGGDTEHRLRQELLLGVGGVRVLDALGVPTQVFHTNEGHAGFLGLERIRRAMVDHGLTLDEAVEAVRAATVFTTHTPVPAGIDRFPYELMERYFGNWAQECGVSLSDLMALGHEPGEHPGSPFNMAVMGLRLAGRANGVSRLHGEVSRSMFNRLWAGVPDDEVPIDSVTNGVHARTWVSAEMSDLLDRHVLPEWPEAGPDRWRRLEDVREDELWRVRQQARERMVAFVRSRLKASALGRGLAGSDVAWCDDVLDAGILTVGFARRFAGYKRPTLLLRQPERLKALLLSADQPVQFVFAGKAHPADEVGKEMIRQLADFARQPDLRHRIAFVEDYDIAVARALYQGCDVWLNNPRRPLEASGTSGEKAALNGALNCSISDGWWDEMFDGENGWAISSAEAYDDLNRRDEVEAASLFDLLERQIVPLFYERDASGVPRRWVRRVVRSLVTLGAQVTASRMVRDYVERLYEHTAERADALTADGYARARSLASWKQRVRAGWDGVAVHRVDGDDDLAELGAPRKVSAVVALGALTEDDVEVQLLHGPVGHNKEMASTTRTNMTFVALESNPGTHRYEGWFSCDRPGRYGYTVRVVPAHPDMSSHAELGCMTVVGGP